MLVDLNGGDCCFGLIDIRRIRIPRSVEERLEVGVGAAAARAVTSATRGIGAPRYGPRRQEGRWD
jgi:hypothetical protein